MGPVFRMRNLTFHHHGPPVCEQPVQPWGLSEHRVGVSEGVRLCVSVSTRDCVRMSVRLCETVSVQDHETECECDNVCDVRNTVRDCT